MMHNQDKRRHTLNFDYFSSIDSEHKAYWLGFIMSDGHLTKNGYRLTIRLSSLDIKQLEKFKKDIEFSGDIKMKTENTNFKKNSSTSTLEVNSKELVAGLNKYIPLGKKSDKVEIPNIADNLFRHFIRGYYDGNGYVVKTRKHIGFVSNVKFIEQVKNKLVTLNVVEKEEGYIRKYENDIYGELNFSKIASQKVTNWMYEDADISLERKKDDYYL